MDLLLEQINNIVDKNIPLVSNLSNISALLFEIGDVNWAGFYLVEGDKMYLGPFQGEVACTTIQIGKGVCGTCLKRKEAIIVPDVHKFKGHIACSSKSNSEIVVPVIKNNEVKIIIDIDSPTFDRFKEKELNFLIQVADIIKTLL